MRPTRSSARRLQLFSGFMVFVLSMLACSQGYISPVELTATAMIQGLTPTTAQPTATLFIPTSTPETPTPVPTFTDIPPTATWAPTRTTNPNATAKPPIQYYTQAGDTLPSILGRFGVSENQVLASQPIPESGLVSPGILLIIPDVLEDVFESTVVMPDSEVVFSPSSLDFDVETFVDNANGYLSQYSEIIGPKRYTGSELIKRVALENSINPYLLLAILEYKSHWVYKGPTNLAEAEYPMGYVKLEYKGLYKQLSWTVSQLSIGYYGWRAGILTSLPFTDGTRMRFSPGLNAGTVAVQYLFAHWYDRLEWAGALYGSQSMPALMEEMFGNFLIRSQSVEPLYPPDLQQPQLELPFYPGKKWSYTGGPHSAWGPDGALAAVDFAPPSSESGCVKSIEWVTAMAPGLVVRSNEGVVVLDLDGDGIEQTGWNIMYLHIETNERVPVGTYLQTGEKIGHPSCEGGTATGTHVHVARKYNGEWILAGGPLPFMLSGYTAQNGDKPYEGTFTNGSQVVWADPLASPSSNIWR